MADLYRLPAPVLNAIRNYVMGKFPIRLSDAPSQVGLFAYDNNAFIVQSFLPTEVTVTVSAPVGARADGPGRRHELSPETAAPQPAGRRGGGGGGGGGGRGRGVVPGTRFSITIPPHSYRAFAVEN